MKKFQMVQFKNILVLLAALAGATGLMACGSSNNNTVPAAVTNPVGQTGYGNCQSGYVYSSSYGCLPQSGCAAGSAMLNSACVAVDSSSPFGQVGIGGLNGGYNQGYNQGGRTPYQGMCPAPGYVQTSAGCLPQGMCMAGYGFGGNWCYPATTSY